MTAISRSKVKIWITPLGTAASTLLMSGTSPTLAPILGEIKSYGRSGGEDQVDSDPVFGGFVDIEKPPSQVEVTFDVIPSLEYAGRWDELINGIDVATGVYTLATQAANKTIFIQATDGTNHFSWGFNNCNAVSYTNEHASDSNRSGKFSFKFSPTNSQGVSNYMAKTVVATVLPAWTALDNN
jgi:hypothetical protein